MFIKSCSIGRRLHGPYLAEEEAEAQMVKAWSTEGGSDGAGICTSSVI